MQNELYASDLAACPSVFCASRDDQAPLFSAPAIVDGQMKKINLHDFKGKWCILFFYPSNFTFVWPTELAAVAAIYPALQKLNTELLAISTDSVYSHKVFLETSPSLKNVTYPLLSDRTQEISRAYRVLDERTGAAFRASFIINPDQIIDSKFINPSEVGRNANELLRVLQGIQYAKETGMGVPANWQPGQPGIKKDPKNIGKI